MISFLICNKEKRFDFNCSSFAFPLAFLSVGNKIDFSHKKKVKLIFTLRHLGHGGGMNVHAFVKSESIFLDQLKLDYFEIIWKFCAEYLSRVSLFGFSIIPPGIRICFKLCHKWWNQFTVLIWANMYKLQIYCVSSKKKRRNKIYWYRGR